MTLSCINHGLWSWALFLIFRTGFTEQQPYLSGAFLGGIFIISIADSAWSAFGMVATKRVERSFPAPLRYRTVHPTPTAWEWYFSQQKPCWVLVTLKDGGEVYGLFGGEKSFAGDQPECRDLYLEETFQLLDDGQWAPMEDTGGVLIMGDQIATIEFRNVIPEVSDE